MLKLTDLNFAYSPQKVIFDAIELIMDFSKIYILSGNNGSGKTTLCRILSGLERNYTGNIFLFEQNIQNLKTTKITEKILYLKQEPLFNFVSATPDEDLFIWQTAFKQNDAEKLVQQRKKALKKFNLEKQLHIPVWDLSYGQMKCAGISASSIQSVRFPIFDEPLSGLDAKLVEKFMEYLQIRKKNQLGALIITHQWEKFQKIADKFYSIENKKIVEK